MRPKYTPEIYVLLCVLACVILYLLIPLIGFSEPGIHWRYMDVKSGILAIVGFSLVGISLVTGKIWDSKTPITRVDSPLKFWSYIVIFSAISVFLAHESLHLLISGK